MKEFIKTLFNHRRIIREQAARIDMLATPELLEAHMTEAGATFSFESPLFHILADGFVKLYRESNAINFFSIGLTDRKTGEAFDLIVQRAQGKPQSVVFEELRAAHKEAIEALRQACDWMDEKRTPVNALMRARDIIAKGDAMP